MDRDALDRLSAGLADRYRLGRELGRGGMATVYLGEDLRHHRPVAVKVLKPELAAALGPARFIREIEIAARLDHPHVLPLYDSGEAGGFLYYVMPYVEGESLRGRLDRERQLPLDEALQIAREVADALSYAHSRDVVHRDIKPENILLAGGHARVADFGIARAITEAGGDRLTATGIAIGTPTYMSPEQAAGSRDVDGRSDLYSLGCVLFEMLAGQPPFAGPAESVVYQHLSVEPPAISRVRPAVPPAVAAALERALAKTPADRFSPAAQFAEALRVGTGAAPAEAAPVAPAPSSGPRWRTGVAYAVAAALVLTLGYLVASRTGLLGVGRGRSLIATGAIQERERVILADFRGRTADPTYGATVTELMRIGLSQSRAVSVLDPLQVGRILQLMARDPAAGVSDTVALQAAEREGIKAVVTGEIVSVGTGFSISARLVSVSGEVLTAHQVSAAGEDDLVTAVDRLSTALRERFGESLRAIRRAPPLEQVTTASHAALRVFTQGLQASNLGDDARATTLLEEAIGLDSTFAMAWRKLAILLQNSAERRSRAVEAATRAYEFRDRLTERERYLVTAAYHSVVTGDRDRVINAYRTVLDLYPDDTYALNNLGVIYGELREYARAGEYYARALAVDSTNRLHYSNLASAIAQQKRFDSAAAVIERFADRFPGNPEVTITRIVHAAYRQDYDRAEALGVALLAEQRGTVFWEAIAYEWMGQLDALRGRLGGAERRWDRALLITAERGLDGQYLLRASRRAVVERLLLDDPERARRILAEATRRYPLEGVAALDRPYGHLALAYAAAEEPARARALLDEYARTADADHGRGAEQWKDGAAGVLALTEGRLEDAIAALGRFDDGNPCATCAAAWLGRAYDRAGRTDSAAAMYRRLVETPSSAIWYDAGHVAHGYLRLGEISERKGERAQAVEYYTHFIQLWDEADPRLHEWVARARAALTRLAREPGGSE